jgi:hypothetical protein
MAVTLPSTARTDFFERHIRRLAWYALLASIALLIPLTRVSLSPDLELVGALGAIVIVIAVFTVIRDVGRYVRQEQVRRRDAARASHHVGACLAAATIHDRVANLLSVTVGYVELVAEVEQLSPLAREQADRAVQAALSASRAVSAFKESLGCAPELAEVASFEAAALEPLVIPERLTFRPGQRWAYDPFSRTIQSQDGVVVATISPALDRSSAMTAGRLMTESPAMWEVLGETQHLGVSLLTNITGANRAVEQELSTVLERINGLVSEVQP